MKFLVLFDVLRRKGISTGTIDHDELFLRNLLSEQVYVFFLLIKFSSFTNPYLWSSHSSMINLLTAPLNCKITWQFLNTPDWLSF
jgi:hypothetical protein